MNIGKDNDFTLLVNLGESLSGLPFELEFCVGGISYIAEFDGDETYTNCEEVTTGQIRVVFHNHFFPVGSMRGRFTFYTNDDSYPEGSISIVRECNIPVSMVDGDYLPETEAWTCVVPGVHAEEPEITISSDTLVAKWTVDGETLVFPSSRWHVVDGLLFRK